MATSTQTITARVRCIRKTNRSSPYERIRAIGGMNLDGKRWELTTDQAIQGIESGKYAFYVERPAGDRVNIIVAKTAAGRRYLKTEADGDIPNNLLSLPERP